MAGSQEYLASRLWADSTNLAPAAFRSASSFARVSTALRSRDTSPSLSDRSFASRYPFDNALYDAFPGVRASPTAGRPAIRES